MDISVHFVRAMNGGPYREMVVGAKEDYAVWGINGVTKIHFRRGTRQTVPRKGGHDRTRTGMRRKTSFLWRKHRTQVESRSLRAKSP